MSGVGKVKMIFMATAASVTLIKCDNSGKAQLLQHAKKEKHKQAIKHVRSNNQAKLLVTASAPSTS